MWSSSSNKRMTSSYISTRRRRRCNPCLDACSRQRSLRRLARWWWHDGGCLLLAVLESFIGARHDALERWRARGHAVDKCLTKAMDVRILALSDSWRRTARLFWHSWKVRGRSGLRCAATTGHRRRLGGLRAPSILGDIAGSSRDRAPPLRHDGAPAVLRWRAHRPHCRRPPVQPQSTFLSGLLNNHRRVGRIRTSGRRSVGSCLSSACARW